jgi:hypothetical protein
MLHRIYTLLIVEKNTNIYAPINVRPMTTALEIPFPTFARIYPEQEYQLAALAQQFRIPQEELYTLLKIAGPVEKDVYDYLRKLRPLPDMSISYTQLLFRFQTFIDAAIENYRQDFKQYVSAGGENGFYEHSWVFLLSEVMEEASNLINEYSERFGDREKLWQDLKRIAEGYLLVLDKVLA